MSENLYRLESDQVLQFLPHRYPFVMIDRILGIQTAGEDRVGLKVISTKNVSRNEPCFQGHFPGFAVLPGVLIIEAMAQTAAFSAYPELKAIGKEKTGNFECILVGVDSARFRKPVLPGDTLKIESTVSRCRGKLWAFKIVATVEDQLVAEAEILANLIVKD